MAKVLIKTTEGDIKVRLYDETPQHRDNFLKLAKEGYFDGTLFHRVIKDFMIHHAAPAVISCTHKVGTAFPNQLARHRLLLGRVIYGDGMTAMLLHHLHARHVGFSISEVNHSRKGDRALAVGDKLVHPPVVAHLPDALVDLEEKLRLGGVIHGHGWPVGDAVIVIEKRAGIDVLEFLQTRS